LAGAVYPAQLGAVGAQARAESEKELPVRIFQFDPDDYSEQYARQQWVHIENGMDPEFLAEIRSSVHQRLNLNKLDRFAIKGKKEQALYTFPDAVDYPGELFDVVSAVCGLRRETMTLSERHIQAYESEANPNPQAHKDRFPSQVSVGFSVEIPEASRLVLYPYDHRDINPFNMAAALIRSLQPHELPDVALQDAREVEIADRPGDVVMFAGSSTWHLRRRSAGAVNLYVKLNDFDCDPLGEDPGTEARREHTLAALASADGQLGAHTVKLSRRFDAVERRLSREGWHESLQASLYAAEPFGITAIQLDLLRASTQAQTLSSLISVAVASGHPAGEVERDAATLLERGALDLLD
jgi:hypothetical protein